MLLMTCPHLACFDRLLHQWFLHCTFLRALSPTCGELQGSWGEAAKKLAEVVDDDTFRSLEGKSKHQLWLELCDIITRHPNLVRGMKVDAILRSGIRKFTDEVQQLCATRCACLLFAAMQDCSLWVLLALDSCI